MKFLGQPCWSTGHRLEKRFGLVVEPRFLHSLLAFYSQLRAVLDLVFLEVATGGQRIAAEIRFGSAHSGNLIVVLYVCLLEERQSRWGVVVCTLVAGRYGMGST